jgi:ferredoxin
MKIVINRAVCSGHARCNAAAPELFELNDEGYVASDGFDVRPGDEAAARRGARACPERAIKVIDDPATVTPHE